MPTGQLQIIRLHVADIWAQRSKCWGCVTVTRTTETQLDGGLGQSLSLLRICMGWGREGCVVQPHAL